MISSGTRATITRALAKIRDSGEAHLLKAGRGRGLACLALATDRSVSLGRLWVAAGSRSMTYSKVRSITIK